VKILLDECLDRRLARDFLGHEVDHVRAIGWASLDDGELIRRAAARYDAFITVDRGIAFQQDLTRFRLAIFILRSRRITRAALAPLIPEVLNVLPNAARGTVTWIGLR